MFEVRFCHLISRIAESFVTCCFCAPRALFGISGRVRQVPKFSVIDLPTKRVGEVEALPSAELGYNCIRP